MVATAEKYQGIPDCGAGPRFADADWSTPPAGTTSMVNNLYQGMTLDAVTGLYNERARWYSPSLGTWISQDPLSYINGANTYQFVDDGPMEAVDPIGLFWGIGESYNGLVNGIGGSIYQGEGTIGDTATAATLPMHYLITTTYDWSANSQSRGLLLWNGDSYMSWLIKQSMGFSIDFMPELRVEVHTALLKWSRGQDAKNVDNGKFAFNMKRAESIGGLTGQLTIGSYILDAFVQGLASQKVNCVKGKQVVTATLPNAVIRFSVNDTWHLQLDSHGIPEPGSFHNMIRWIGLLSNEQVKWSE